MHYLQWDRWLLGTSECRGFRVLFAKWQSFVAYALHRFIAVYVHKILCTLSWLPPATSRCEYENERKDEPPWVRSSQYLIPNHSNSIKSTWIWIRIYFHGASLQSHVNPHSKVLDDSKMIDNFPLSSLHAYKYVALITKKKDEFSGNRNLSWPERVQHTPEW